jgi:starch phosphorylase
VLLDDFTYERRVAYFTMEIALRDEIPTYAGGLGVLAGDTLRSAVDLEVPMVAVSLVSRQGYFRQQITSDGRQVEQPATWQPEKWTTHLGAKIAVEIEGRTVWITGWVYVLSGGTGAGQPVILLDADLAENHPDDRRITDQLYGGDQAYRLKQEVVLGIGGVRMLRALGFKIWQYHMNEGHSALLTVELLKQFTYPATELRSGEAAYDFPRVRELCKFTTHTPVPAAHDQFPYELVERMLGNIVSISMLQRLAGESVLNMTQLALSLSDYVNGVAKRHAEVSSRLYHGYVVHAVSNGVHPATWTWASFASLYDRQIAGWCHQPELLVRADCCLSDEEVWQAHQEAKRALIDHVQATVKQRLDPALPIIGFARRMTAYKRPDLLFSDLGRLIALAQRRPFQLVLAGKAHPQDEPGKRLIELIHAHMRDLAGKIPIAYLPDYGMSTALRMVAGVDVWLNTPLRPLEASGTSGMKAALNGVPHLSVLDGWWIEGCIEGVNGWAIGDDKESGNGFDSEALYQKLGNVVLPLYHDDRPGWIKVMKGAITKSGSFFNSHRMMRRYVVEAYLH